MPPPRIALVNPIASHPPSISTTEAASILEETPRTRVRTGLQDVLRLARTRSASLVVLFATLPLRNIPLILATVALHKGIPYAVLPPNHSFRRTIVQERKISGVPVALALVGAPESTGAATRASADPRGGILLKGAKDCIYTYTSGSKAQLTGNRKGATQVHG